MYKEDRAHQFSSVVALTTSDTNVSVKEGVAGMSIYITDIVISVGATAGYVTLQDDADVTYCGPVRMAVDRTLAVQLKTPIKWGKNRDVEFDKEAACDEGSVFVAGYFDR